MKTKHVWVVVVGVCVGVVLLSWVSDQAMRKASGAKREDNAHATQDEAAMAEQGVLTQGSPHRPPDSSGLPSGMKWVWGQVSGNRTTGVVYGWTMADDGTLPRVVSW